MKWNLAFATMLIALGVFIISGCVANDGGNNQTNNTDNETVYIYGSAAVQNVNIQITESFPVQIRAIAEGYLPDGCTQIDNISQTREGNAFLINITTKRPAEAICTQALAPFEELINLNAENLPAGNYTVNVNGIQAGFELGTNNSISEIHDVAITNVSIGEYNTTTQEIPVFIKGQYGGSSCTTLNDIEVISQGMQFIVNVTYTKHSETCTKDLMLMNKTVYLDMSQSVQGTYSVNVNGEQMAFAFSG
ncbi:MAG: hypothetical protein HY364_04280 [Candidatus Aenigmarchaeota archaeon]|nr:hypothetical protein [Candidatus Aenigmarchaeota archaeon]